MRGWLLLPLFSRKREWRSWGRSSSRKMRRRRRTTSRWGPCLLAKGRRGSQPQQQPALQPLQVSVLMPFFRGLLALLPACWLVLLAAYFEVTFVFLFVCFIFPSLSSLVFLFVCFGLPVCVLWSSCLCALFFLFVCFGLPVDMFWSSCLCLPVYVLWSSCLYALVFLFVSSFLCDFVFLFHCQCLKQWKGGQSSDFIRYVFRMEGNPVILLGECL